MNCGNKYHPRFQCPARNAVCHICGVKGHFSKVCNHRDKTIPPSTPLPALMYMPTLSMICSQTPKDGLSTATQEIFINGKPVHALFDTGSTENFVDNNYATSHSLTVYPAFGNVLMATTALSSKVLGYCIVNINLSGTEYTNVKLIVMENLCKKVIMGLSFMIQQNSFTIKFGGSKSDISVYGLASAKIVPPSLFTNLTKECKPIATKLRTFNNTDKKFIETEIHKLFSDGIIEPSSSPWHSQVLVTAEGKHKRHMVIDFSQTVNRFTLLDAYPLPHTSDIANSLTAYNVFSTFDLECLLPSAH